MSKAARYLSVCINVLYAAMGSGPRRQVDRDELEHAIGKGWTAFAMSLPVLLLFVWLAVWVHSRFDPAENVTTFENLPGFGSLNTE